MARKIFYMVRHGESWLNAAHVRQGPEGSLSDNGRMQAKATGERLKKVSFDAILVSPYQRTKETAETIIAELKHKRPMEFVDLLTERRNPSEIVNRNADDPEVKRIVDLIDRSFHDDSYRYSDEENFTDLKQRAKDLLAYLETRPEKKLLLVTHSIFLKMVAAYLVKGDKLTAKQYNLLSYLNTSSNASITVCEYNSGWLGDGKLGRFFYPIEGRWKLIAWDDYTRDPSQESKA
ncbi:MAG TPA: histidine phosphatase family protein [Candidatus Paceibacterota bacterium]